MEKTSDLLISYFNGEFVPDSQCVVHVTDRGFRYGDAVFDIERTFDGQLFHLREHLGRLMRSLKYARMDPGISLEGWEELTVEVLTRNESFRELGGDFSIGQYLTRGRGRNVLDPVPYTVCVRIWHRDFTEWARFYRTGVHAVIPKVRSYAPEAADSKVKHHNRLNFALAHLEAADVDPDAFPLLLDGSGNISENIQANVFLVQDGVLKTPRDNSSLQGDARSTVFGLADTLKIPVAEEDLQPYDAYTADEAFLTNTAYCIMPVGRIDTRPIGTQVPGPITRRLQAAWSEMVGIDIVDQALNYRPTS